jgi:hypothetical protein
MKTVDLQAGVEQSMNLRLHQGSEQLLKQRRLHKASANFGLDSGNRQRLDASLKYTTEIPDGDRSADPTAAAPLFGSRAIELHRPRQDAHQGCREVAGHRHHPRHPGDGR